MLDCTHNCLCRRLPGDPALASTPTEEVFLAFGRVFSGTARQGAKVHVLSAAYRPEVPNTPHRQEAVLGPTYMMMGRALERLKVWSQGCGQEGLHVWSEGCGQEARCLARPTW